MADTNPITAPPDSGLTVSMKTIAAAGLHVDIYGLAELPPTATSVSCLWLHHPRLRSKEEMAETAHAVVSGFYQQRASTASGGVRVTRGLIAVAFDQRNHGTRLIDPRANEAWRQGNAVHAQDMFGMISGAVSDTIHLLDVLEGYLFPEEQGKRIDQNFVLGVSLGGHSAWQLVFAEPRVTAGVMIIGCPDYMRESWHTHTLCGPKHHLFCILLHAEQN
jgi:hypothetical protein